MRARELEMLLPGLQWHAKPGRTAVHVLFGRLPWPYQLRVYVGVFGAWHTCVDCKRDLVTQA